LTFFGYFLGSSQESNNKALIFFIYFLVSRQESKNQILKTLIAHLLSVIVFSGFKDEVAPGATSSF
jgi:hypothetical protein